MATSRADVYADEGVSRATRSLRPYLPRKRIGVGVEMGDLMASALTDLRHWCDARGLHWEVVLRSMEEKYQGDRAGRPERDSTPVTPGCDACELIDASCEDHQEEAPKP